MGKVWKVLRFVTAILFWLAVLIYIAPRSIQLPKREVSRPAEPRTASVKHNRSKRAEPPCGNASLCLLYAGREALSSPEFL